MVISISVTNTATPSSLLFLGRLGHFPRQISSLLPCVATNIALARNRLARHLRYELATYGGAGHHPHGLLAYGLPACLTDDRTQVDEAHASALVTTALFERSNSVGKASVCNATLERCLLFYDDEDVFGVATRSFIARGQHGQ
jgi:hypothetical protein